MHMQVATTKNASSPTSIAYVTTEIIHQVECGERTIVVHPSYNPLIDCYMISDYITGYVISGFAIQKTDNEDSNRETVIKRFENYVKELDPEALFERLMNIPEVNGIEETESSGEELEEESNE